MKNKTLYNAMLIIKKNMCLLDLVVYNVGFYIPHFRVQLQ